MRGKGLTGSAAGAPAALGLAYWALFFTAYSTGALKLAEAPFLRPLAFGGNKHGSLRGRQTFHSERPVSWIEAVSEGLEAHPVGAALFIG